MAIGPYRGPGEIHRPVHVGSGRARVGMPGVADVAGMFGDSFKGLIRAGNTWYQGVIDTGKALQGAGRAANGLEGRFEGMDAAKAAEAKRVHELEMRKAEQMNYDGYNAEL